MYNSVDVDAIKANGTLLCDEWYAGTRSCRYNVTTSWYIVPSRVLTCIVKGFIFVAEASVCRWRHNMTHPYACCITDRSHHVFVACFLDVPCEARLCDCRCVQCVLSSSG